MKQLPYSKDDVFNVYRQFLYEEPPTAKQITRDAGFAKGEIRVKDAIKIFEPLHWKNWPPAGQKILSGTIVGCGNKPTFVIVWIGDEKYYL